MPLSFVCVVAFLALGVRGAEHIVTEAKTLKLGVVGGGKKQWSASSGAYPTIKGKVGDTVVFNFNGGHDVQKMSDATCGTTGNTKLASTTVGGGVSGGSGLTNKFTYTVTAADVTAGAITFACSEPSGSYGHCNAGQKITVNTATGVAGTPVSGSNPGVCTGGAAPGANGCCADTGECPSCCSYKSKSSSGSTTTCDCRVCTGAPAYIDTQCKDNQGCRDFLKTKDDMMSMRASMMGCSVCTGKKVLCQTGDCSALAAMAGAMASPTVDKATNKVTCGAAATTSSTSFARASTVDACVALAALAASLLIARM